VFNVCSSYILYVYKASSASQARQPATFDNRVLQNVTEQQQDDSNSNNEREREKRPTVNSAVDVFAGL
jgi:hypothetical protein